MYKYNVLEFYFIITNFVVSIEFQDSQIVDLEVSSSLKLGGNKFKIHFSIRNTIILIFFI